MSTDAVGLGPERHAPAVRRELGLSDFTLLVIGAVIGADVYVVAAMGAASLGPAQLVAWLAAGAMALVIAVAFVQCAAVDTEVGGSYAYARSAFGPLAGFTAGWALYAGEFIVLPVFPLAFGDYLHRLAPDLPSAGVTVAQLALIALVTATNVSGVRRSGRLNDALTLAKLVPLAVLIVLAIVYIAFRRGDAADHLHPFAPLGWGGLGTAIVPIFWAFAGFELSVLPAAEVRDPARTLPRGLVVGMAVATVVYLFTALAVVAAVPWQQAAASSSPLADALNGVLGGLGWSTGAGAIFMSLGALVSIAGVYEAFTLGVSRLSYALAADGLFPRAFAHVDRRFGTPSLALIFQAAFALVGTFLLDLRGLITAAVLFLSASYFLTALSALRFTRRRPERALHVPALTAILACAAAASVYLAAQASARQAVLAATVMAAGLVLYGMRRAAWRTIAGELRAGERRVLASAHTPHFWLLDALRRHGR